MPRPDSKPNPRREVMLTLNEVYWLMNCAEDYRDHSYTGQFAGRVSDTLFDLWCYWSKRTDDPTRFTLRVLR